MARKRKKSKRTLKRNHPDFAKNKQPGSATDEILRKIYYDPTNPASFSGVQKLYREAKHHNIKYKAVQNWLNSQKTHSLYKQPNTKFKRDYVAVVGIDEIWDADLADMSALSKYNNKTTFLLVVIDIFSRRANAIPLKSKRGIEISNALKQLTENAQPKILRTDNGTEFKNIHVRNLLKDLNVKSVFMYSDTKANYVERFILTLKRRLYKYMHFNDTFRYVDVLSDVIKSYNNTYHRSLGGTPNSVTSDTEDQSRLEQHLIKFSKYKHPKIQDYRFNVGDNVRLAHARKTFDKAYFKKWTDELFKVTKRYKRHGIAVYNLVDWNDEEIIGSFYTDQLQLVKITPDTAYKIESIVKRRTVKGQKQVYVKWSDWDDSFNSWISAASLEQYKQT